MRLKEVIMMINLKNCAATMKPVKEEVIVDLEDVLCGEVKECMMDAEQTGTLTESVEANRSSMQHILCGNDDDLDIKVDHRYMKLLDSFREDGNSYLGDNPLMSIRYEVDNGGYDKREFKAVTNKWSVEDRNTIRVTKKYVETKPHVHESTKQTTKEADFVSRRRESPVTEKSLEAMLVTSHVKRNSQNNVDAGKKENSERQMVLDENYRSYLTWLVEKSKSPRINSGKEIKVKCEEDTMSLSGSDIIAVEDRPFLDEEDSPFVPSKDYKVIDLEEGSGDQRSSSFKKEIMNILKQPYSEDKYEELRNEASVCRFSTKYWELRDGRDISCETDQKRPSYLDTYPDFKRKFEECENDRHRALNLLRGFIFYLTNLARQDAFKPWCNRECLKITCS